MLDKFLPPTDNLYKFLAISGLLLIVLSFVPNYFNFQLWEQKYEYLKTLDIYVAELEKYNEDYGKFNTRLKELNQKYDESIESYKKHNELGSDIEKELKEKNFQKADELYKSYLSDKKIIQDRQNNIKELKTNIENEKKEIDKKTIEIKVKKAEIDKTKNLIEHYNEEISRLRALSILIFVLGIIAAISGFFLWYYRIQKYDDLILANEANIKSPQISDAPTVTNVSANENKDIVR